MARAQMTYYIVTILLLAVLAIVECAIRLPKRWERLLLAFTYLFLVAQLGLRWETGTDWNNYYFHFVGTIRWSDIRPNSTSPEYGYNLLVWLVHSITDSYSLFLTVHAAMFYGLLIAGLHYLTRMTYLPLLMVYCAMFGYTGANRELLALAVGLYALRYLIEGRIGRYFLLLFVAVSFHYSALLMLFYIPLLRMKRLWVIAVFVVICLVIGSTNLPLTAFETVGNFFGGSLGSKALFYINSKGDEAGAALGMAGLVRRLIYLAIALAGRRKLIEIYPNYDFYLTLYMFGMGIYFLFARSLLIMVSRGSVYFEIFGPVLLSIQLLLLKTNRQRVPALIGYAGFAVVLFVQSISVFSELFVPYKGLFLNSGYSRTME